MTVWTEETTQGTGYITCVHGIPGNFYVGFLDPDGVWFSVGNGTWTKQINFTKSSCGSIWIRLAANIWALEATDATNPVFGSGSDTWVDKDPFGGVAAKAIQALPGHIFAGPTSIRGLLHSVDDGVSWTALGGATALADAGAISPQFFWAVSATEIYATDSQSGTIFKWDGATWNPIVVFVNSDTNLGGFTGVWASGSHIYLAGARGTSGQNAIIWASHNGGSTWSEELFLPPNNLFGEFVGIYGNADTVFAVGDDGFAKGLLYGSLLGSGTWSANTIPVDVTSLNRVFTDGVNHYAVGGTGLGPVLLRGASIEIAAVLPTTVRTVRVKFSLPPAASDPNQAGDVLNPATWEIVRSDNDISLTILRVVAVSSLEFDVTVLEAFPSEQVSLTITATLGA